MRRRGQPGNIEQRGDSFRVRLCVGGQRHRFTVVTRDRRVAERFAAQKLRELERDQERADARRAAGLADEMPVSALLERFGAQRLPTLSIGTRRSYGDSLKVIARYFVDVLGDPDVASVRAADVTAFLAWRRVHRLDGARPVSNRTLQKDRTILHLLFAMAERDELRDGNPVSRTSAPKIETRNPVILSDAQYERLLAACVGRPMLYFYVLMLGESGLRCESEALHLRWEDLDIEEGFVSVVSGRNGHRTKSGKGRFVPMTPRLAAAVREHMAAFRLATYEAKRSPWVFHHVRTRRHHRVGTRIGSVRNAFRNAAKRAGLPPEFHQHDLRHRRVTTWLAEGKNPVHVMEAMGHSDLKTTMGYTHLSKTHLRALVREDAPTWPPRPVPVPPIGRGTNGNPADRILDPKATAGERHAHAASHSYG